MSIPWLIPDHNFPECRIDDDHGDCIKVPTKNGATELGTVIPGIIDIGNLLGTGGFAGFNFSGKDQIRSDPVCGADVIVTVLYQHRKSLLRQFLDYQSPDGHFIYAHHHIDMTKSIPSKGQRPFVITRTGNTVEAGFRDGYVNGAVSPTWETFIRYTILPHGEWQQEFLQYPGLDLKLPNTMSCSWDSLPDARVDFEVWAGRLMAPGITERRWIQQPGFIIDILIA